MPVPSRLSEASLMQVFFLHGFASSSRSAKAVFFAERLRSYGLTLHCPDFNEPDFSSLTMTRMLEQLAGEMAAVPPQPIVLVGSSLGAVVAIHTAARTARIDRLVLLAPAVTFGRENQSPVGPERLAQWRAVGTLDVPHSGYGGLRPLNFGFHEDSFRYDAFAADVRQPTLIFQGRHDDAVDCRVVEEYAATRPNMKLTLLDDDHRLMASLPRIWNEMTQFLELTA
jgi:pimeloyl-ACP methyl ester carboxylesterase